MSTPERQSLLARVAELYYIQQLSQSDIARELGYSRSAISRFLAEAREAHIVEITIHYPQQRNPNIQQTLIDTFHLRDAVVVSVTNNNKILQQIGRLGADYLLASLPENGILGISWGIIIGEVISHIKPTPFSSLNIVQIIGSIGRGDVQIDGNAFVYQLGSLLRAKCYPLNAPLIADTAEGKKLFINDRSIRETLGMARKSDVIVVGIGTTDPDDSSLLRTGYVNEEDLSQIEDAGGVGNICGTFFDVDGNILNISLNERVVGLELDELAGLRAMRIGIAAGKTKIKPILGALRGGFINVLITDTTTAQDVLDLHQALIKQSVSS